VPAENTVRYPNARASVNTMREVIKGVLETELQGCTYNVRYAICHVTTDKDEPTE